MMDMLDNRLGLVMNDFHGRWMVHNRGRYDVHNIFGNVFVDHAGSVVVLRATVNNNNVLAVSSVSSVTSVAAVSTVATVATNDGNMFAVAVATVAAVAAVAVVATANNNNVLAVPVVSVTSVMVATSFNNFHSTSVSVRTALFDNDSLSMSTTSPGGGAACGIEVKIQVSSLGHKSHAGCEECSFEHYFYFIRLNKILFIYSYFTTVHR